MTTTTTYIKEEGFDEQPRVPSGFVRVMNANPPSVRRLKRLLQYQKDGVGFYGTR